MNREDFEEAKKVRLYAHSPYNKFCVGAVLRCKNGKTYTGCNIDNNGLLSICAERTAFVKAISEGETNFESITIVGAPEGQDATNECLPCGYCRQFMNEFVDKDFKIYTQQNDIIREYTIDEILPYSFKL